MQLGRKCQQTALTGIWMMAVWGLCLAAAQAGQVLRLGHQFPRNSLSDRAAQHFAQQVAEKSQGALEIRVFPAATLGDEREQLALLRKQTLDFALTGDLVISSLNDRFLVVNLPFLYRDSAHAMAIYNGPLGQAMRRELEAHGLKALAWHEVGNRMLTANRPVRNIADIRGLKLRLPVTDVAWTASWRALGANVRQVQFTDLPLALKTGLVEAQENPPGLIRSARLNEHQKYLMDTRHMPQRQFIFTSVSAWSRLDATQRRLVQEAATAASAFAMTTAQTEFQRDLDWLVKEGGMTLIPFDASGVSSIIQKVPARLAGTEGEALYREIRDAH